MHALLSFAGCLVSFFGFPKGKNVPTVSCFFVSKGLALAQKKGWLSGGGLVS